MEQLQFDFGRGDQLALLDGARIVSATVGRSRVSGAAMRHVLRVIDSHGRGRDAWPSLQTIACETSLGVRTCKRAIAALVARSLLIVTKRRPATGRAPVNHYRIVWTELALLARPVGMAEHGATGPEHGATMARAWGHYGTQSVKEPQNNPTPTSALLARKANYQEEEGLRDLVSEYQAAGVYDPAQRVCDAVRRSSLAHVRAVLEHYHAQRPAWGPGALALRLGRIVAGLAVEAGWPPPANAPGAAATVSQPGQRGDALRPAQVRAEQIRFAIIRAGRTAGLPEPEIAARCAAAGVEF